MKKVNKKTKDKKVQVSMYLLPEVSAKLRSHLRRRGDMSRIVSESLDRFDHQNIRYVPIMEDNLPETTVLLEVGQRLLLKTAAAIASRNGRKVTMNAIINAALMAWEP